MQHHATTGNLLWRVTTKWRTAVDRAVGPLGLTHAKYTVLASLLGLTRTGARPSQRELADFTGLEPIFVSKMVRALAESGLLSRTANPADPRAVQLALTDRGADTARRAIAIVRDLQEELTASIGGTQSGQGRELARILRILLGVAPSPTEPGEPAMTQPAIFTSQDIAEAQGALRALIDRVLRDTEVTSNEYVIMRVLAGRGPVPAEAFRGYLAEQRQLGLDPDAADALLQGLRSRGLIAIGDTIRLTPEGADTYERLGNTVAPITRQLYDGFEPGEIETVHRVLRQITERAAEVRKSL